MRHVKPKLLSLYLALMAAFSAQAATLTVGGSGCQHAQLQAAIDQAAQTAEDDVILIANNVTYTNQALTKSDPHAVSVVGGYANCGVGTQPTGSTAIDGSGRNARSYGPSSSF